MALVSVVLEGVVLPGVAAPYPFFPIYLLCRCSMNVLALRLRTIASISIILQHASTTCTLKTLLTKRACLLSVGLVSSLKFYPFTCAFQISEFFHYLKLHVLWERSTVLYFRITGSLLCVNWKPWLYCYMYVNGLHFRIFPVHEECFQPRVYAAKAQCRMREDYC